MDNNTGKFLKPAPIFDNGFSLTYGAAKKDYEDIVKFQKEHAEFGKYLDFDVQAKLFLDKAHASKLRKLVNFEFRQHPIIKIDDLYIKALNAFIQHRARTLLDIYKDTDNSSEN